MLCSVMFLQVVMYFNSIKVQLELVEGSRRLFDLLFQFHKGTIRTTIRLEKSAESKNFNSIKVQLELAPLVIAVIS